MGADCDGAFCGVAADGLLLLAAGALLVCGGDGNCDGGGGATGNEATDGCTTRLLTTVRTPAIWAASPLAMVRAASLLTVPLKVTTPLATEA